MGSQYQSVMTLASYFDHVFTFNVSICSLNSSMLAMCYCGKLVARYIRISLKVDPPGGGDASKNH